MAHRIPQVRGKSMNSFLDRLSPGIAHMIRSARAAQR
jgi:hypothetical protein